MQSSSKNVCNSDPDEGEGEADLPSRFDFSAVLLEPFYAHSPERQLAAAVMKLALDDLRGGRYARPRMRHALFWLCSKHDDPLPAFSCQWISEAVGIQEGALIRLIALTLQNLELDNQQEEKMDYIAMQDCKGGVLYRIDSRNLYTGVYDEVTQGFTGIRTKFGDRYLFEEYHWDKGMPFGTVKPIEPICECPIELQLLLHSRSGKEKKPLLDWIDEQEKGLPGYPD